MHLRIRLINGWNRSLTLFWGQVEGNETSGGMSTKINEEDSGNVVISTTFNGNSAYSHELETLFQNLNDLPFDMLLSVISRVMMISCDLSLEEIKNFFRWLNNYLEWVLPFSHFEIYEIFVSKTCIYQ